MSEQERIIGRGGSVTVVGSYGETRLSGPPDPPEDPSKWHEVLLTQEEVCERYHCRPEDIETWIARYGMPTPASKGIRAVGNRNVQIIKWSPKQLAAWEDGIRELVGRFPERP